MKYARIIVFIAMVAIAAAGIVACNDTSKINGVQGTPIAQTSAGSETPEPDGGTMCDSTGDRDRFEWV